MGGGNPWVGGGGDIVESMKEFPAKSETFCNMPKAPSGKLYADYIKLCRGYYGSI